MLESDQFELQTLLILLGEGELGHHDVLNAIARSGQTDLPILEILIREGHVERDVVSKATKMVSVLKGETILSARTAEFRLEDTQRTAQAETQPSEPPATMNSAEAETAYPSDVNPGEIDPGLLEFFSTRERYIDLKPLGRGGMANVILAHDRLMNREVALKVIRDDSRVSNAGALLFTEARVTGLLDHPGIVPVFDIGRDELDCSFYTMRALSQPSLAEQADVDEADMMTVGEIATAMRQVCLTVQFAHERGVIHRDLTPGNILLGDYGEIYVVDWGVARIVDETLGLNRTQSEPTGLIVGTMQYMSPEQARGDNDAIDVRSDVYGLGAVLYFGLTGQTPFPLENLLELREAVVFHQPKPVQLRAPGREIPQELAEICHKALAKDPDHRYQSAKEMASDLGYYLAGEKRRLMEVDAIRVSLERGETARLRWGSLSCECLGLRGRCAELESSIPSWAPEAEKRELWQLQARIDELTLDAERAFGEAVRHYSQALAHAMDSPEARKALGEMYWLRLEEASAHNRTAECIAWEGRILQYGDQASKERLSARGEVQILSDGSITEISLCRYEEHGRRLVPVSVIEQQSIPATLTDLEHGSYRLRAVTAEGLDIRVPVSLARGESVTVDLKTPAANTVPDGFAFVHEGVYARETTPVLKKVDVSSFSIMTHPVTCGEYLEFLNAIRLEKPELAAAHAPRVHPEAPSHFEQDEDGRYQLPAEDPEGDTWHEDWPIILVNYEDCVAYAKWKGECDGLRYRLPTSDEWQKAARGVDGRMYPWGHHFDATFCCMRDSTEGRPMPALVGSFENDISPYGVRDMAGNVAEWTSTPAQQTDEVGGDTLVLEGAAYNSASFVCSLDFNMTSPRAFRYGHYGFRLVSDGVLAD